MGAHRYSKSEPANVRGWCAACGDNLQKSMGGGKFKAVCSGCDKRRRSEPRPNGRTPWAAFKGDRCEACGFIPEHPCQLDVDHVDGNKANRDPSNYRTLCANCHRLKTFRAGEFGPKKKPPTV